MHNHSPHILSAPMYVFLSYCELLFSCLLQKSLFFGLHTTQVTLPESICSYVEKRNEAAEESGKHECMQLSYWENILFTPRTKSVCYVKSVKTVALMKLCEGLSQDRLLLHVR